MSFVYAINSDDFLILSDTKIELNEKLCNLWNAEEEKCLIKQLGLIKSVIISPNIVVCYAGNNINKAAEFFQKIQVTDIDLESIVQIAFDIHNSSRKDDIEFIIAFCDGIKRELISIKDKQVIRNCKIAWLGSWEAYNEFKRLESEISDEILKDKKAICYEENGNITEEPINQSLVQIWELEKLFRKVVESGIDSTVGGMVVRIKIPEGEDTFQYMAGMYVVSSAWPQTVGAGQTISLFQGADKGSYCCNIYQSKYNFCCYIYEDALGIVYTDKEVYVSGLEGMKFPKLYNMDKQSFDCIAELNGAYSSIGLL